jgi:hypothetical protein
VRLRLGLAASEISDTDTQIFIVEAAAILSTETNKTLDSTDCSEAEANAIANLAAIYCYLKVTGISSTGWNVNLGQLSFSGPSEKVAQLEFLKRQVRDFIDSSRAVYVGSV